MSENTLQQEIYIKKSMKQSFSMNQLKSKTQITTQFTKQIVLKASDFSTYFSIFLGNSKGKDKFLSLFQYTLQFICLCTKHSNIPSLLPLYKTKQLIDILIIYNIKQNISAARKVFRLLRFLDQIKGLSKILKQNRPLAFKILSTITYCCSTMYYITDNLLWFMGIGVKSQALKKQVLKTWKDKKNFFSLYRIIFYLVIIIYSIYLQKVENNDLQQKIKNSTSYNNHINSSQMYIANQHLSGRRKLRFLYLEIFLSFCRLLMLIKSLKLKFHENLDPVFIGGCGVAAAILNFLRALFEKKIIINLHNKVQASTERLVSISRIEKDINTQLY